MLTAIFLTMMGLASGGCVPFIPRVCNRFGVRRSYVGATIAISCIWAILGLLVLAGIQDFWVLCLSGVLLGALMSVTTVIKPFFARSFLRGDQISESYARQSLVTGLAWAVGALGGGFIIETLGTGWAIERPPNLSLGHRYWSNGKVRSA